MGWRFYAGLTGWVIIIGSMMTIVMFAVLPV